MKQNIRWMLRRDIPELLTIMQLNDKTNAIEEQEFVELIAQRNIIVMVVEVGDEVLGFMVYELNKIHINLFIFEIHPKAMGNGLGTALLNKIITKINNDGRRKFIATQIRESNLNGLLWAKNKGFIAKSINKSAYSSPDDDGIFMVYDVLPVKTEKGVEMGSNTIKL